jgi:phospholipid/cholesterol/gamma-HCH transport system substrate-binding protein
MVPVQDKRSVIVGIFILLALTILAAGILVIGNKRQTFEKTILLYAIFDNVNGLQRGNNVWFSGVKVGMIKHLRIESNGKVAVEMKIEKQAQRYILSGARAKIGTDGLIGNKIIEIFNDKMGSDPIHFHDTLITEINANTAEMTATLQESNKNLSSITSNFRVVSDRLVRGEGTIGTLLTNDQLARQLQSTAARLQVASDNIQTFSSNMAAYTARLQTKGALANELVTDTVIFGRLKASAAEIQSASVNIQGASVNIQRASVNATELTNNLKRLSNDLSNDLKDTTNITGVLLHDRQSADNMKATISNIRSGTKKFDENMEALQHNFLFRRFFKKRARQQAQQKTTVPEVQQ